MATFLFYVWFQWPLLGRVSAHDIVWLALGLMAFVCFNGPFWAG